jgi:hypothetical protein
LTIFCKKGFPQGWREVPVFGRQLVQPGLPTHGIELQSFIKKLALANHVSSGEWHLGKLMWPI